jgi:hypothetical protein
MFQNNLNPETAVCLSMTLVPMYWSTWCHYPEDNNVSTLVIFIEEKRVCNLCWQLKFLSFLTDILAMLVFLNVSESLCL